MPTFEIQAPDGKKYRVSAPDGATKEQALERVKAQIAGGQPDAIPATAGLPRATPADVANAERLRTEGSEPNNDNALGQLMGSVEPLLTVGSGMVGQIAGNIYGVGKTLASGEYGTQEGIRIGKRAADEVAAGMTYQPRTDSGRAGTRAIAALAQPLEGLQGIGSADAMLAGRAAASGARSLSNLAPKVAEDAAAAAKGAGERVRSLARPAEPAPLSGVGAAQAREATTRAATAESLPVPIRLTRGQRTRKFDDQRFEQETAKDPVNGERLRNRFVEQNQQILQNLDAFADETGSQSVGLRATGKVVDQALINRVKSVKNEIRNAYKEAEAAGEMQAPAPYQKLTEYLTDKDAEIKTNNAPMLAAVAAKLEKLDPEGTGVIPLKEFEELRKMAGRLSPQGSTSSAFVGDVKKLIDEATEGAGGVKYQQARRMYENYQREFKDAAVIDKMLRTKPGTKDRAVALEDIVDHAVLRAQSLDDVRKVRNTLTKAGEEGTQAWKELQAESLRQIKERALTQSSNTAGERIFSAPAFSKMIQELDADGRLDFMFTKQGAQKLRDLDEIGKLALTSPPGSVNTSNTASVVMAAMDAMISSGTGLPLPLLTGTNYLVKRHKAKKLNKRIDDALNPDGGQ